VKNRLLNISLLNSRNEQNAALEHSNYYWVYKKDFNQALEPAKTTVIRVAHGCVVEYKEEVQ
jgi:hypothetical protein